MPVSGNNYTTQTVVTILMRYTIQTYSTLWLYCCNYINHLSQLRSCCSESGINKEDIDKLLLYFLMHLYILVFQYALRKTPVNSEPLTS